MKINLKKINWWVVVVIIVVVGFVYFLNPSEKSSPPQEITNSVFENNLDVNYAFNFFPLIKGTYWIYEGSVKATQIGGKILEKNLTWKMEVLDVISRDKFLAASIKGYPGDLGWYEEGRERGLYTIIIKYPAKFYLTDADLFEKIRNDSTFNPDLSEDYLFLNFPLSFGKKYGCGDEETMKRADNYYCWYVKNVSVADSKEKYELQFYTLPAEENIDFIYGIGIQKYEYIHHGPPLDAYLKLKEYYIPKK